MSFSNDWIPDILTMRPGFLTCENLTDNESGLKIRSHPAVHSWT